MNWFTTRRPLPRWAWWIMLFAWVGLIFWFSSVPDLRIAPDPLIDYVVRKFGHAGIFGILALLAYYAVGRSWRWALGFAAVYAALDEFHQGFTANRTPFVGDVVVDVVGAIVALVVWTWLLNRMGTRPA